MNNKMKMWQIWLRKRKMQTCILFFIGLILIYINTPKSTRQAECSIASEPYIYDRVWGADLDVEFAEPIYKEPVDLVYLWVNGTDPKFLLDMKRQRALEDEEMYSRPLVCSSGKEPDVNIPILVVYPAISQPYGIPGIDNPIWANNITEKDFSYTMIIPNQEGKDSFATNVLIKKDGQTYICMCGYITNKVDVLAKKTLENMYLMNGTIYKDLDEIPGRSKQVNVILYTEVNGGTYALLHDKSGTFENDTDQHEYRHEPAILVWDPNRVIVTRLPNLNRFEDNDQLLYSLRSVEKYASWIQNIYIITNQQVPSWLNVSNPRISVISTEEIFPNKADLPSFSSPALESHMHRIPNLSETFLFMCDDFFFGKHVDLRDFYTAEEGLKLFWDGNVPKCNLGCNHMDIGNGKCDRECDNLRCGWDHGDCKPIQLDQIRQDHPLGNHFGSLFHTMAIFNRKFNRSHTYRLPPHVPLLVSKKVARDLQNSFHKEFEKSSAMHFRTQFNIQYTMAYYEFVSSGLAAMTLGEIFDKLDRDKSGTLSLYEYKKIKDMICVNTIPCQSAFTVSKEVFTNRQCIINFYNKTPIIKPRHKHTITKADHRFLSVTNNLIHVQEELSKILRTPSKFIAVNDGMDLDKKESIAVKKVLRQFYEMLFPNPSQFEIEKS